MLYLYTNISNTDLNSDTKNRRTTNTFKDLSSQMLTIYHMPKRSLKISFFLREDQFIFIPTSENYHEFVLKKPLSIYLKSFVSIQNTAFIQERDIN